MSGNSQGTPWWLTAILAVLVIALGVWVLILSGRIKSANEAAMAAQSAVVEVRGIDSVWAGRTVGADSTGVQAWMARATTWMKAAHQRIDWSGGTPPKPPDDPPDPWGG